LYGEAVTPWIEESLTTRPQPWAYMCGNTWRRSRNGASTMMRSIHENFSGGNSWIGAMCCTPASLISTSMPGSAPSPSASTAVYRSWHTNGRGTEQLSHSFALID
jgi:hypothetical protein